jgi:hypothetical protein
MTGPLRRFAHALVVSMSMLGGGVVAACGSSHSGGVGSTPGNDAAIPPADAGDAGSDAIPSGTGSGTVTGSLAGKPFGTVAAALWAGAPDDGATTLVYLFSAPVACSELATPGWDTRIAEATSVLEMKSFGTTPGDYAVVSTLTPAPGEASVNYTLSTKTGTPQEQSSSKGTVTLTKLDANVSTKGSFTLAFGTSTLTGSFDAVYCPGGHEP